MWASIYVTVPSRHGSIGGLHVAMVVAKPGGPVHQTWGYLGGTEMVARGGEVTLVV